MSDDFDRAVGFLVAVIFILWLIGMIVEFVL